MGGILLLNLNMRLRPIEKKYCEGRAGGKW